MNALEILKKLRKYELEKEEHQLMLQHREVYSRFQSLQASQNQLQSDLLAKETFRSSALLRHFDTHFVESEQLIQKNSLDHQKSLFQRDQQIEKTLLSKQRHDMIERVLEHRHELELSELDQQERKFLDDVTQTRYAMGISS